MRYVGMLIGAAAATFFALGCATTTTDTPDPDVVEKQDEQTPTTVGTKLYMDVHQLGRVSFRDVEGAHQKDLATQAKYGVSYKAYWVDEASGTVYCLVESPSAEAANAVHKEAHGLVAMSIAEVTADNKSWAPTPGAKLFMDIHRLGKGNVTPEDLAAAHAKDLAAQGKYGVKFLNYWLDKETGTVMCLAEGPSAEVVVAVHKEAHGLVPDSIVEVLEGR